MVTLVYPTGVTLAMVSNELKANTKKPNYVVYRTLYLTKRHCLLETGADSQLCLGRERIFILLLPYMYCNLTYLETSMAKTTQFGEQLSSVMLPAAICRHILSRRVSHSLHEWRTLDKTNRVRRVYRSILLCNDDGNCGCSWASVCTQRSSKLIHRKITCIDSSNILRKLFSESLA